MQQSAPCRALLLHDGVCECVHTVYPLGNSLMGTVPLGLKGSSELMSSVTVGDSAQAHGR